MTMWVQGCLSEIVWHIYIPELRNSLGKKWSPTNWIDLHWDWHLPWYPRQQQHWEQICHKTTRDVNILMLYKLGRWAYLNEYNKKNDRQYCPVELFDKLDLFRRFNQRHLCGFRLTEWINQGWILIFIFIFSMFLVSNQFFLHFYLSVKKEQVNNQFESECKKRNSHQGFFSVI